MGIFLIGWTIFAALAVSFIWYDKREHAKSCKACNPQYMRWYRNGCIGEFNPDHTNYPY